MKFATILELGRVSNLPTVWSNAMAAAALAGGAAQYGDIVAAMLSLSLFYIGGMWLNDAFDAKIDAQERSTRPIPRGEVSQRAVFIGGAGMLAAGVAIAAAFGAFLEALGLAIAIVLYDWLHKHTVFSPVLMGAARFFSYAVGAGFVAYSAWSADVVLGAAGLMIYVMGLTYAAKQEAYDRLDRAWPLALLAPPILYVAWCCIEAPETALAAAPYVIGFAAVTASALHLLFRRAKGDVPQAVVTMISAISLYDAALIASTGETILALIAAACGAVTLVGQRWIAGS